MFTIIIQEKGGEQRRMVFNKPEVTIGRVQGNDIVLPKGNVSKRHARIVLKDGKFIIVDLKSTNGTYVNGRKITSPLVVKDSDKIYIGDFIVGVDEAAGEDGPSETTTSPPSPAMVPEMRPRPGLPTEAVAMGSGGGMPPTPEPSPGPPPPSIAPRSVPPRQPPGPSREMRNDPGSLGPPAREPGAMPPLSPPPASDVRTRPPIQRSPGGTMPPPISPVIPPVARNPMPEREPARDHDAAPMPAPMPSPMAAPRSEPYAAPAPAPLPTPTPMPSAMPPAVAAVPSVNSGSGPNGAPAPVVPLADKNKQRQAAAAAAAAAIAPVAPTTFRRTVNRSVSVPSRRGVHLEPLDPKVVKMLDLQSNILERLRAKLDLDKIAMDRLHEEELWKRAERATIDLVETLETSGELPKYIDQDTLIKETLNEALALGPLEDLLADEKIDEIIIDKRDRVVVGKEGQLRGSGKAFSSDDVFERVVKRLVAEAGSHIDEANPLVDLRMRDGTRLTAAVAPVAARGACLVLKKPAAPMPSLNDLATQGALSGGMADFLSTCMSARRNILVCGPSGSGKTTVVAALASAAPAGERVISIEDVAEISINRDEWIQLETRPGNGVAKASSVDMATLLETALRLAPDRLVVGEVRGREALPLVSALCTSVDGAVVAMTGDGANATLNRLVTLARVASPMASDLSLRELVAQAFEIVVHVARWTDGSLRVMSIEEVIGCNESSFDTHVLFQYANNAFGPTGTVPRFYAELEARGIPADQAVFR